MDRLTLLRRARDAGLRVAAESGKLVIRGPKQAEPVARFLIAHKAEVLAALDEAADWQSRHAEALMHWRVLHPAGEAAGLAWAEMEVRWHRVHGERIAVGQCAGCGETIGKRATLGLADGCRVHCDTLDCLLDYGRRWRSTATAGLRALGLDPPADEIEP